MNDLQWALLAASVVAIVGVLFAVTLPDCPDAQTAVRKIRAVAKKRINQDYAPGEL